MQQAPLVSLLTPTYERGPFLRLLARMVARQTVPLHRVEWLVVDDSARPTAAWLRTHPLQRRLHRLHYEHLPTRLCIGAKRNYVMSLARGEYCVQMDDDDCYGARYVEVVLRAFAPNIDVVGSSLIHLLYPGSFVLWRSGPFGAHHTCAATLSFRRSYADTHRYLDGAERAEERSFLDDYRTPIQQMDETHGVYFALVHARNTVDKRSTSRRPTAVPWAAAGAVSCDNDLLLFYYWRSECPPLPPLRNATAEHRIAQAVGRALLRFVHALLRLLLLGGVKILPSPR